MMKKILNVYDIFEVNEKGVVIVGTNPSFDNLKIDDISKLVGKKILLSSNNKSIILNVLCVECSTSIINKKNIFIIVNKDKDIKEFVTMQNLKVYIE